MSDLITRARKEWCEFSQRVPAPPGLGLERYYGQLDRPTPCPPEVVAALLEVLDEYKHTYDRVECRVCCGTVSYKPHEAGCSVVAAEAAITRALEGKP